MARATTLMEDWLPTTSSGQIPGQGLIRGHHARAMKVRRHRVTINHQPDQLLVYLRAVHLKGQALVKEATTTMKNGQERRGAPVQRLNANVQRLERITMESVPALTYDVIAGDLPEAARMYSGRIVVQTCSELRRDHQEAVTSSVRQVAPAISVRQEVPVTSGHRAAPVGSDIPALARKGHPEVPASVAHRADPPVGRVVRGPAVPADGEEDSTPCWHEISILRA